jgi:hypothetical protein
MLEVSHHCDLGVDRKVSEFEAADNRVAAHLPNGHLIERFIEKDGIARMRSGRWEAGKVSMTMAIFWLLPFTLKPFAL